jgi:hypothetical protein
MVSILETSNIVKNEGKYRCTGIRILELGIVSVASYWDSVGRWVCSSSGYVCVILNGNQDIAARIYQYTGIGNGKKQREITGSHSYCNFNLIFE